MIKKPRLHIAPNVLFYVLVFYMLAFSGWWTYLLLKQNNFILTYQKGLVTMQQQVNEQESATKDLIAELEQKNTRRIWMIAGEGFVFIALLIAGIWKLRQSLAKEMKLSAQQKNFLLSVTHEFRTPLAAIKLALQTIGRKGLDEQKKEKLMNNSLGDVDRLNALVENILFAARIDNATYTYNPEPFDLSELTEAVMEQHIDLHNGQIKIDPLIKPGIRIKGDRVAMASVISNLLENAFKYSPKEGEIQVSLRQEGEKAILDVKDQGTGVPIEEKSSIFLKFYRVGNEETRNHKGTGLGLYITREVVHQHHGTIRVKDNEPRGSVFEVVLPVV